MAITKILRSTTTTAITLPPEIWKKAGWKLNDKVEVVVSECHTLNKTDDIYNSICIERVEDLVKYDRDYALKTEIT